MGDKVFWDIIAYSCEPGGGEDRWHRGLVNTLAGLPPDEIVRFKRKLDDVTRALDTTRHRAAARLINGVEEFDDEDEEDQFDNFCYWIVCEGKAFYEEVASDPDALADYVSPGPGTYAAALFDVAYIAWENKGLTMDDWRKAYRALGESGRPVTRGEEWDFDDAEETAKRLPRLSAKFGRVRDEDEDD